MENQQQAFSLDKTTVKNTLKGLGWYLLTASVTSLILLQSDVHQWLTARTPIDWRTLADLYFMAATGSAINGLKEFVRGGPKDLL